MILIVAALKEELDVARSVVGGRVGGKNTAFVFARTGVGPRRSVSAIRKAVAGRRPASVLCIGYAGALDPSLRVGDLVAVSAARLLELPSRTRDALQVARSSPEWSLAIPAALPASLGGAYVRTGSVVTAPCIIGRREDRQYLFDRFGATAVDMETAAIAGALAPEGLEFSALRSISDAVADDYLVPLSYDGRFGLLPRATRLLGAGDWGRRFEEWRDRTAAARESLREGLRAWLSCRA